MDKNKIIEAILKMKVEDMVELVSLIEKKFNISSDIKSISNDKDVKKNIEKKEFDIILKNIGKNKISVIKEVRNLLNLGLKESKDLVESFPILIKKNVNNEETKRIKEIFENIGAEIEIK